VRWQDQLDSILAEGVAGARRREQSAFDQLAGPCAQSLVLYGAGNLGRKVLRGLRTCGLEPIAFADANPAVWGKKIENVQIFSPQDAVHKFGTLAVFVVCVWHPDREHGVQEILDQLGRLGAKRVTPFVWLYWKYPARFLPYFLWDLPSKLVADADAIWNAARTFPDDASRAEFVTHVRFRANGDFNCLAPPAPEPAYFPRHVLRLAADECFVDCGAFDGDTIREFVKQSGGNFRKIVAFEPDPHNFKALQASVLAHGSLEERTLAYPYVLGAVPGKVRFQATGGLDAAVSSDGDVEVNCTTLDDVLGSERPTFIKMDIEGAEMDALAGGRRIIQQNQPVLAVCVYHRQDDLWRVPLLFRELEPEARLALRMYWRDSFDLVCFAVPPERVSQRGCRTI